MLIGMPGSGKSTLGKRLAKTRGLQFTDTDTLIEQLENKPIQRIVDRRGVAYLRSLEEQVLCGLDLCGHIVATGGSAVYSTAAMRHLGSMGVRVYLRISLATMTRRVQANLNRGLAKMPGHPLARMYCERKDLYESSADITVDNNWPISAVRFDELNRELDGYLNGRG